MEKITRKLSRRALQLWNTGDGKADLYNRRAWLRAVAYLGDKWILARPINARSR